MENKNVAGKLPVFERLAKALGVAVDDIAFGLRGPQLVSDEKISALAIVAVNEPETMHLRRYTTASLAPVANAQEFYELAKGSMEIVPHVLVAAGPAQMEMIEECLEILKVISEREWFRGRPVASDAYDDADFPETSRLRRLAELFNLIKGHDIRILASSEINHYPPGVEPCPEGERASATTAWIRDRSARALPLWSKDQSGYGTLLAFHGFGLEEAGDYTRAEDESRAAAEFEPLSFWPHHTLAHVMEMTGRPEDGVGWMAAREALWSTPGHLN